MDKNFEAKISKEDVRRRYTINYLIELGEKKMELTDFKPVVAVLNRDEIKLGLQIVEFKDNGTVDLISSLKDKVVTNLKQEKVFMFEDFNKASASALINYP